MELTSEELRWLTGLAQFDNGNMLAILAVFAGFGLPRDYLDVGCGTGAMVKAARLFNIPAFGVDILPHDEPYLYKQDLNTFCDLGNQFDLVTSIEVAEHIAEADIFCDTLARHVAKDGMLVLTSAPPGQIGDGHINCQPKQYWKERLIARGLHYNEPMYSLEDALRRNQLTDTQRLFVLWRNTHWATHWCEENLQVFRR